jgi:DNA-binding NarL/FixJ family response regulator
MDLGLALPREAKRVTAHGMVIGTPAYLSPEQAQGQKLDPRTDIYSLGIVLYEMATGQLPFNADDIGALLLQQVKQPPQSPRLIVPDLPVELQNVILKSLEKPANRRYQSGNALAEALEASLKSATSESTVVEPTPGASVVDTLPADRTNDSTASPTHSRRPKRTLRVILADDHTLLRKTLANLLETREDFVVVAEAGDGDSALKQTLAILPDVLVLDLNMPSKGGLDILPTIRRDAPSVKVLVLTGREEEVYIVRALRAGAHGYVLKSAEENELIEAIGKVTSGQMYLGRGVAEKVVTGLLTGAPGEVNLNEDECKLLLYVAAGYENEQIARKMEIPMMNAIEMLARAMNKLGAKDRHAAALKALRMGAILIEDLHHLAE